MVTGYVMVGKAEVGLIVCGPLPTILKAMISAVEAAFAAMIASRRLQCATVQPLSTTSSVELTTNVDGAMGVAVGVFV
jgi:hypothetical protein